MNLHNLGLLVFVSFLSVKDEPKSREKATSTKSCFDGISFIQTNILVSGIFHTLFSNGNVNQLNRSILEQVAVADIQNWSESNNRRRGHLCSDK